MVTGATGADLENGSIVILIFVQGLLFGYHMDETLINPKQCSHYGIPAFNNLHNKHREFGIENDDDLFIPMVMNWRTCGFSSRCPTKDEMKVCKGFVVYHYKEWYSSLVHFNVSSLKKDNRYELYTESLFINFSNSPCSIALDNQSDTSNIF